MTKPKHLPECFNGRQRSHGLPCICDRLRACEQRSYTLGIEVGKHDGWVAGHAAGVQAARQAVVERSMTCLGPAMPGTEWVHTPSVLAAIDALRGER